MPIAALAGMRSRLFGGARSAESTPISALDARTQYIFSELQKVILGLPELDAALLPNVVVNHKSTRLEWEGFSYAEDERRWSEGNRSVISFAMAPSCPKTAILHLDIDVFRRQSISINLNDKRIFSGKKPNGRHQIEIRIDNLRVGPNRLIFSLPNAAVAGNGDSRLVAIAFRTLRFERQ
jgi:hypothetical protein